MTLLQKYHTQRMPSKLVSELLKLNKELGLKYPDHLKYHLKLLAVKNSLAQKDAFEQSFEAFRNRHIDMWDNILFQERNKLFQLDFEETRKTLHHFQFEGERIYIPVFDILFNNLYDRETAILELPQYFKLQSSYKDELIEIDKYGLLPYQAHFVYPCLGSYKDSHILFDASINTFYRVNDQVAFYPLYDKVEISGEDAQILANYLTDFNDAAFFQHALDQGYLHPKLQKKVEKIRK